MGDCPNTLIWVDRANDAFHAAAKEPGESLRRMTSRCRSGLHNAPVPLTAAQCERMRLLAHDKLPAEAQSKYGQAYVNMGELYYGFGDYVRAITAIECGLTIGQVTHLDDAYVYLGRSFVAIDDIDDARKAFVKLKDVPNSACFVCGNSMRILFEAAVPPALFSLIPHVRGKRGTKSSGSSSMNSTS